MDTGSKTIFVPTDQEWNDAYRKFEAKFDSRRDERRTPSKASLALVVGTLLVMATGGAYSFMQLFS